MRTDILNFGKIREILSLAFLLVLFFSPGASLAQSSAGTSYMGRFCWTITIADTTVTDLPIGSTFVITSNLVNLGGSSFAFTGYVPAPGDNPAMFGGVAQIIGNTIYFHLTGSQSHLTGGWRDSSVMHAEIDASTLSGTFYEIGNDFNVVTRSRDSTRYTGGTMALASTCP